jgi:hypothetical protein
MDFGPVKYRCLRTALKSLNSKILIKSTKEELWGESI